MRCRSINAIIGTASDDDDDDDEDLPARPLPSSRSLSEALPTRHANAEDAAISFTRRCVCCCCSERVQFNPRLCRRPSLCSCASSTRCFIFVSLFQPVYLRHVFIFPLSAPEIRPRGRGPASSSLIPVHSPFFALFVSPSRSAFPYPASLSSALSPCVPCSLSSSFDTPVKISRRPALFYP